MMVNLGEKILLASIRMKHLIGLGNKSHYLIALGALGLYKRLPYKQVLSRYRFIIWAL